MMDINNMLSLTRHSEFPSMLPAKKITLDEKYSNLTTNLNLSLAKLFMAIQEKKSSKEILDDYCEGMRNFFAIANFKEWAYIMLISDEDLENIKSKWKSDSLSMVYLSIQQQIENCYFKRQPQGLVHAWHMYLKLGLIDLGFDAQQIEEHFVQMYS